MAPKQVFEGRGSEFCPANLPEENQLPQWTFVKRSGVGKTIKFDDGSEFQFRRIKQRDGGFLSTSHVTTTDEKLAKNLRSVAQAGKFGVVEIPLHGKE